MYVAGTGNGNTAAFAAGHVSGRGNGGVPVPKWRDRCVLVVSSVVLAAGGLLGVAVASAPAAGASPSCTAAGSTGFTAAVVAQAGQTITSSVVATGCGVGIYVPPGATGVTINGATVSGADDHGILAEDTSGLTVEHSTIEGNGLKRTAKIDRTRRFSSSG